MGTKEVVKGYIKCNAKYVLRNAISHYLWYGTSLETSIAENEDYIREYHYCDPEKFTEEVRRIFDSCHTMDGLMAFLKSLQESYVSRKTIANEIKEEFGESITIDSLYHAILSM